MADDTGKELGFEESEIEDNPAQDRPTPPPGPAADMLAQRRSQNEMAALGAALNPPPTPPGRIAVGMRNRARFLRSKLGNAEPTKVELDIIAELDAIGAEAQEVEERCRLGKLSDGGVEARMTTLGRAVFAVRGRFEALLVRQDLPHATQAERPGPSERKRELDAIEEFLARKHRRRVA